MLKKIHSNREPGTSLYGEIKKEFGHYFAGAAKSLAGCLRCYPRLFYATMILVLASSLILSFTVFRLQGKPAAAGSRATSPAGEGFERISHASAQILETMKLKQLIDSLTAKKILSEKDTLALDSALDRLREINKPLNQ